MPDQAPTPLVIKDFRTGIGPSPHLGFGDMRNLDTSTIPGIARLGFATTKVSGTAVADLPIKIIRNDLDSTEFFALDASGTLYQSNDSGATWQVQASSGAPTGGIMIQLWEDFLFFAKATTLSIFGPLSSGPTAIWTNTWQTIDNSSDFHPMLRSLNDGMLYGGSGYTVFSVEKGSGGFRATGGATSYTFTQQALDIIGDGSTGEQYRIKCLEELGSNLMIGTDLVPANSVDKEVAQDGVIFPWDRSSASFGQPLLFNMNGINQMKTINNVLYVQAGLDGRYYRLNGGQYTQVASTPEGLVNIDGGRFLRQIPAAIEQFQNKLFFGLSPGATATDIGGIGVWSLDPTNNVLNFENQISTGNMGDTTNVKIGSLLPFARDRILIGWKDGATAGIDITGTGRYSSYAGYLESPFYQVGTPLVKREFTQLEFQLAQALATGQGVKIKYRTDLSASFTTIGTYDFATLGAVMSHNVVADIPACEFVQIRVELTCAGTNASPQLRTVTLK